jgi:hypothetical protein
MRAFAITLALSLVMGSWSYGQEEDLNKVVKASLVFRDEAPKTKDDDHLIHVYLCLDNRFEGDVTWVCNSVLDVKADLLDAKGRPVPLAPAMGSMLGPRADIYRLPYASRLEWRISHAGVSLMGDDPEGQYALIVGGKGWWIPKKALSSYSLKICVKGWPMTEIRPKDDKERGTTVLFDVPTTKIVLDKTKGAAEQSLSKEKH